MPLCIGVREQELVQPQQRQLYTSASLNKKYEPRMKEIKKTENEGNTRFRGRGAELPLVHFTLIDKQKLLIPLKIQLP